MIELVNSNEISSCLDSFIFAVGCFLEDSFSNKQKDKLII